MHEKSHNEAKQGCIEACYGEIGQMVLYISYINSHNTFLLISLLVFCFILLLLFFFNNCLFCILQKKKINVCFVDFPPNSKNSPTCFGCP